jgi:phosphotransferase system HPr (HPr) family protein
MIIMIAERLTRRVRIGNEEGLHLRAAALFSQLARSFACDIRIMCAERQANAKSVWELIGLAAEPGTELVIEAVGSQSEEALDRLEGLVAGQFRVSAVENSHENS